MNPSPKWPIWAPRLRDMCESRIADTPSMSIGAPSFAQYRAAFGEQDVDAAGAACLLDRVSSVLDQLMDLASPVAARLDRLLNLDVLFHELRLGGVRAQHSLRFSDDMPRDGGVLFFPTAVIWLLLEYERPGSHCAMSRQSRGRIVRDGGQPGPFP